MPDWRPMTDCDPSKFALLHDKLNGTTIDWDPHQHQANYEVHARQLEAGVIAWGGLLLDRWQEPNRAPRKS